MYFEQKALRCIVMDVVVLTVKKGRKDLLLSERGVTITVKGEAYCEICSPVLATTIYSAVIDVSLTVST